MPHLSLARTAQRAWGRDDISSAGAGPPAAKREGMSASIEARAALGEGTGGGRRPATRPRRGLHSRLARRETGAAYLFISPWIFGFIVFTAGPMVAAAFTGGWRA